MKARIGLVALLLSGCVQPSSFIVVDRMTGEVATSTIDPSRETGTVSVTMRGELYTGVWTAMRGAGTSGRVGNQAVALDSDSGRALANLRSPSGRTIRCELAYRVFSSISAGGIGVRGLGECIDDAGRLYDVQMSP